MSMENYNVQTPDALDEALQARIAEYKAHYQGSDMKQSMAAIAYREATKSRSAYLRFGPYWWALKQILANEDLLTTSRADNALVKGIYCGKNDEETMVLAFLFREWYDATVFQGAREFVTGTNGFTYSLYDPDMEGLS